MRCAHAAGKLRVVFVIKFSLTLYRETECGYLIFGNNGDIYFILLLTQVDFWSYFLLSKKLESRKN